jgi:hypothetical protein
MFMRGASTLSQRRQTDPFPDFQDRGISTAVGITFEFGGIPLLPDVQKTWYVCCRWLIFQHHCFEANTHPPQFAQFQEKGRGPSRTQQTHFSDALESVCNRLLVVQSRRFGAKPTTAGRPHSPDADGTGR